MVASLRRLDSRTSVIDIHIGCLSTGIRYFKSSIFHHTSNDKRRLRTNLHVYDTLLASLGGDKHITRTGRNHEGHTSKVFGKLIRTRGVTVNNLIDVVLNHRRA